MNKIYFSVAIYWFLFLAPINASPDEYQELDAIAIKAHTDKGSLFHNYTDIYAKYFHSLRNKPIKFLEIGILRGESVKLWEEYFTHADLHFMDIDFGRIRYISDRSHYHLCNQESPEELQEFIAASGGNFDIIIDDGGHTMNQQITSFQMLFPHIKSGGMYIIEDLHTSYWSSYGGGDSSAQNTITFLKSLIDEVNFIGQLTQRASHLAIHPSITAELNIYQKEIYSMHFYDSLVVIIKR